MKKYIKWIFRVLTYILVALLLLFFLWLVFFEMGIIKFIYTLILGAGITVGVVCIRLFLDWVWSDD